MHVTYCIIVYGPLDIFYQWFWRYSYYEHWLQTKYKRKQTYRVHDTYWHIKLIVGISATQIKMSYNSFLMYHHPPSVKLFTLRSMYDYFVIVELSSNTKIIIIKRVIILETRIQYFSVSLIFTIYRITPESKVTIAYSNQKCDWLIALGQFKLVGSLGDS